MIGTVRGIRVNPKSYATIEQRALSLRQSLAPDVDVDQAAPALRVFEGLGRIKVGAERRGVQYAVDDELGFGVEGVTKYDADADLFEVSVDPATYDAIERNDGGRAFFTVFHEAGHLALHHELLVTLARIPHHRALMRTDHKKYEDSEWQADVFGAAFAMPAQGLARLAKRGMLTPHHVQAVYKVSMRAASVRIEVFTQRKEQLVAA